MSECFQLDVIVLSIYSVLCFEGQRWGDWNYSSQNSFPHVVLHCNLPMRRICIYLGKLRRRSRRTCLRIFYFGVDSRGSGFPDSYATSLSSNYKSLYFPILKSFPLGRFKMASVSLISSWLEWILQWKEEKNTGNKEWEMKERGRKEERGTKLPSWFYTAKQTQQYASSLILHALNLLRRAAEILKCQELWLQASLLQHPRVPIMQITEDGLHKKSSLIL